jgi:hypothetical protein
MTTNQMEACPLCGVQCATQKQDETTTFLCPTCFIYRMSYSAVVKLAGLSLAHRNALMLEAWQAHLIGKVLLVTLAKDSDYKVFDRVREEY